MAIEDVVAIEVEQSIAVEEVSIDIALSNPELEPVFQPIIGKKIKMVPEPTRTVCAKNCVPIDDPYLPKGQ